MCMFLNEPVRQRKGASLTVGLGLACALRLWNVSSGMRPTARSESLDKVVSQREIRVWLERKVEQTPGGQDKVTKALMKIIISRGFGVRSQKALNARIRSFRTFTGVSFDVYSDE